MSLAAPVLNGVTLRRPATYREVPVPVVEDVVLAGGALRRYSRGSRMEFELRWSLLTEDAAAAIDGAAETRDPVLFVTPSGRGVWVLVDTFQADPIPGTYPARYDATLSLQSRDVIR